MFKHFKIIYPNKSYIVVTTNKGWAGLIGFCENVKDPDNTYIRTMTFWEFVKYIVFGK